MFNLKALQKNKTVKYGVPMLLLVIGGSFGLREFTQIRYDAQRIRKRLDPSLEAKVNLEKQSVMLEEEYESSDVLKLISCCRIFVLPAEDEASEFGSVEEHPWSSALGGLQGVPGAAAHQAE
ncbi:cytochrome c oxidase assembly protein COX16 homolog, mitochondrial isoform X1 [Gasterosteus aculeatus]|uniref:Cytochrome c oxidase assembly protein COX16 homolog, mitochondrial n=1 Tax=Gasterosteus aculeatus aculeatus TaxID=481459 RepID=A0AAQ4Q6C1_GASAC|nr:cytochrome c oxidase assembly protein COX16 homolog, mitochondrial isoform X1 [Gasterosteus aculeatus aculeatus]